MANEIRIAVIGQAAFGEQVLKALIDNNENVVAVFSPPDKEGRDYDPLKKAALESNTPTYQFSRMRDNEAIETFLSLDTDLCVMAFVTDIVPDKILEAPSIGTIQYHPSLLPKHRGPSSINWPIINGEKETGLTIFWPDKGLDTGPILLQKSTMIEENDTLGSLYFGRLFPMGVKAMVEAVELVRKGEAPRVDQNDKIATYEGWCRQEDVIINWNDNIDNVYNMIRGSDPSPGAGSTYKGDRIRLFKASKYLQEGGSMPGTVTNITEETFSVQALDGCVRVGRVQPRGSAKIMAPEWVSSVGLRVGDIFGI